MVTLLAKATARFQQDRRSIQGVEVFSVGKHTPSNGPEIEVTADDLDAIVAAFNNGTPAMVPVKFGHTSDAFNIAQAAELLGVTEGLITGEGEEGDGAILPGTVTKLTRVQNKLLADFDVIAPVAPMIADSLLKGISIEITGNVLSAITLLGAERPAVKDLVPIQAATVFAFSMGTANATVLPRTFHTHVERLRSMSWFATDLGLADTATIADVITRLQELKREVDMDTKTETTIRALLGAAEDADLVEVITALKEKAASPPKPSFSERLRSLLKLGTDASEADVLARLEDPVNLTEPGPRGEEERTNLRFTEKDTEIAELKRENSVRRYADQTRNFSAVQGTPEELATRLTDIEEKMGSDAVGIQLKDWEKTQEYAKQAGVFTVVGAHGDGTPTDWDAALVKWKEEHPRETDQSVMQHAAAAIKAVSVEQPALYQEHYRANRKDAATVSDEA